MTAGSGPRPDFLLRSLRCACPPDAAGNEDHCHGRYASNGNLRRRGGPTQALRGWKPRPPFPRPLSARAPSPRTHVHSAADRPRQRCLAVRTKRAGTRQQYGRRSSQRPEIGREAA